MDSTMAPNGMFTVRFPHQDFMVIDKKKGFHRGVKSGTSLVWLMHNFGYTIGWGVHLNWFAY